MKHVVAGTPSRLADRRQDPTIALDPRDTRPTFWPLIECGSDIEEFFVESILGVAWERRDRWDLNPRSSGLAARSVGARCPILVVLAAR
jgi:hypothetical protein